MLPDKGNDSMKIDKLFSALFICVLASNTVYAQQIQLSLPSNLISLDSPAGIELLKNTEEESVKDYWSLSKFFVTEKGLAYCAPASIAMVLNALGVKPEAAPEHFPYKMFNQDNLFYKQEVLLNFITPSLINHQGLSLEQSHTLSKQYVHNVKAEYSQDLNSLEQFRTDLSNGIQNGYVIANFDRKSLNEIGGGHFSPVAAYNAKNDRFLILDVARYKYPSAWVSTSDLYHAVKTQDKDGNQRGILIFKTDDASENSAQ